MSYKLLGINTPTYSVEKLNIKFELNEYPKLITPFAYYKTNIARLLNTDYAGLMKPYTDGSKREAGVGAIVTWNWWKRSAFATQRGINFFKRDARYQHGSEHYFGRNNRAKVCYVQ